jgi:hypothetical protein
MLHFFLDLCICQRWRRRRRRKPMLHFFLDLRGKKEGAWLREKMMQFDKDREGRERGRERWRECCEGAPEEERERREGEDVSSGSKEHHLNEGRVMLTPMLHHRIGW